ncbi:hypothetical protein Xcel_2022 [Xylanimonas cellulosilytica DSM 15894]|uniref:Integral membrane protein n=1 Tax=Xylanimonas cellulosilytica (strain DSM 15894 / JCM 12276 / CECT 5975 / KCTC 9989 / LMG 20990 / NBRC 107835 / XIL07) TaxID=446471 RepID=D1BTR2_XYLCX|nr:DUF3043 domain-containing protein [Xylanimonas cellulosilytica]ACZ31041.1 hypothetical protein Xcel_2022 [Xylanimonas cellulosilytica DSM 15894]
MFSRNKSAPSAAADAVAQAAEIEQSGAIGKGRPTPKRSQAEAANKRPLVPADRRAAARDARAKQKENRAKAYAGMQRGEERFLPARDRGAQRRYIRDYVDARWNLGEFFLPVAFGFILANFVVLQFGEVAAFIVLVALYVIVLVAIADAVILWFRLKRKLIEKFGTLEKGTAMYAVMRAFQLRRSRIPRPTHKSHGVWPE